MVDPDDPAPASGAGKMLITIDPPQHVRLRRLVNQGFTPRRVAQLEPHVRVLTERILDAVAPRGGCDLVTDIAARLPLRRDLYTGGCPAPADWDLMFMLTNRVLGADDPEYQTVAGDSLPETAQSGPTGNLRPTSRSSLPPAPPSATGRSAQCADSGGTGRGSAHR